MDVEEASRIILTATSHDYGNFYGGAQGELSLGVGQIYSNTRFSAYNSDDHLYDTREGLVYVLTHECDIDQDNSRPFNEHAIVCPIIPLENCVSMLEPIGDAKLRGFLGELGKDNISRVTYFPSTDDHLPHGGVIDLNQLSHVHISAFELEEAARVTALTASGLRILDYKITNHLLRPKAEKLALSRF